MRVLIAAGGTAGHINPALAIAGALKAADPAAEIHFAGRKEGMEYGLVTKAGYPFHHIEINGFQRRLNAENIVRNVIDRFPYRRSRLCRCRTGNVYYLPLHLAGHRSCTAMFLFHLQ